MKGTLVIFLLCGTLPAALLNILRDRDYSGDYDGDDADIPEEPLKGLCNAHLTFDAVTSLRGEKFFFKDSFYLRKHPLTREIRNVSISTFWPALKSGVDAAYEVGDLVYFVKGEQYWAFFANVEEPSYPKSIHSLGFPRNIKKIDAAVHDENSGKTYFFSGDKYWRYDEAKNSMENGYPRPTEADFPGVGTKVDAAVENLGNFYFFSGSVNCEFNIKQKTVTKTLKNNIWFGCN